MTVKAIPEGYHSVTPYLFVDGAADAIRWYEKALGATELFRLPMPVRSDAAGGVDGGERIGHAEIRIGDSVIMLADEFAEMNKRGPLARGGPTGSLMIYLDDVDSAYRRAIEAGATEERAPEDQFWGDRMGSFTDPFGHSWAVATHIEDVPEDEMQRRMAQFAQGAAG